MRFVTADCAHEFDQAPEMSAVLTLLRIRNLALVEELEWQLGPGFVAVTGETGAGKSIIIGALQLLSVSAQTNP